MEKNREQIIEQITDDFTEQLNKELSEEFYGNADQIKKFLDTAKKTNENFWANAKIDMNFNKDK